MERNEAIQAALESVKAQASVRAMTAEEINGMVQNVAAGIMQAAGAGGNEAAHEEGQGSSMDPKKSIRESSITCLECGKSFKVITRKHLLTHGLTPDEYRAKYGMKKGMALIAKGLQRERRKKMKDMKLWERRKPTAEGDKA